MLAILTLYLMLLIPINANLTWVPYTEKFDFMTMMEFEGRHICSGVLMTPTVILTAANPFYPMYQYPEERRKINVHMIDGVYDKEQILLAICLNFQYARINVTRVAFDEDNLYAPAHDLAALTIERPIEQKGVRYPYYVQLAESRNTNIRQDGYFTIVGFGFIDQIHVKQKKQLEAIKYKLDDVYVDCDQWVPRNWGYFICILNVERFVGVEAGSALVFDGLVFGIGSFSLRRGKDSILVFTDIRKYKGIIFNSRSSTEKIENTEFGNVALMGGR